MLDRWRGRRAGLAISAILSAILAASFGASAIAGVTDTRPSIVVADGSGVVLARVSLPADGTFSLRYRNSLYGSLAEERFAVTADGRMQLTRLAADELAVLEEYYTVREAPVATGADDDRAWHAPSAREVSLEELTIAATELGERTLLVAGEAPIELWRLVGDDPFVVLGVKRGQ